jgi:hypothetical protein
MLAPHASSQPLLRWDHGPLSVPYRPGTPAYKLQVKTVGKTCIHVLPHILQHRAGPHRIPAREGSGSVTRPAAPNLTTPQKWAPMSPRVIWLWSPPPRIKGLRCWHASHFTPWVVRIKKGLATTSVQRGSCVTKECTHVIEVSARRVARRRYHDLQDMYASVYRATVQCSAMRLTARGRGWHEL